MTASNAPTSVKALTASTITVSDGTQIYYKDWGSGQPVVFSHGWPLSADAWESQMAFLASNGYRCIAHDRSRDRVPSGHRSLNPRQHPVRCVRPAPGQYPVHAAEPIPPSIRCVLVRAFDGCHPTNTF